MHLSVAIVATLSLLAIHQVSGHGYLKTPRSRNFVAFQDGAWSGGDETTPAKENCPHCLNRGGTLGECGISESGLAYDLPENVFGGPLPTKTQALYTQGQEIEVDIVLTAHHKGHFEFHACPIQAGEVPTEECFQAHPLEFVEDLLYNAPKDNNYPGRAYIPPSDYNGLIVDSTSGTSGKLFSYRFKLPDNLVGDIVLIQWHYLTGNSCIYEGYRNYNWPLDWSDPVGSLGECAYVPEDGNGVPEQFWNCAEVKILPSVSSPPTPVAPAPTTKAPTAAPTKGTVPSTSSPPTDAPTPPGSTNPSPPTLELCCPAGSNSLFATNDCTSFYHCQNGAIVGSPIACPDGLLFHEAMQVCDWPYNVQCSNGDSPCGGNRRGLRGGSSN